MASTWHLPGDLPGNLPGTGTGPGDPATSDQAGGRRSWWSRHWSDPMFSGGVIAVVSVLLTMAAGLYVGAEALHVDLGHLGFATLLGR